jgi:uncharacterized protein involved in cysteine biosynthesis
VAGLTYVIAWIFLAGPIYVSIVAGMSSLLWDGLSIAVEQRLVGEAARQELPRSVVVGDSLSRTALSIGVSLLGCCCAWLLPVVGLVLLAGWISLLDFTACAYVRRGVTLGPQLGQVFRLREWPSFMLTTGVLTLLPLVNVFLLPIMVAGGTVMVVRGKGVQALGR